MMYCVKCKSKTNTTNEEKIVTKNNRNMIRGVCDVCGSKKTTFIGSGLANAVINNLPVEMHLPGHNFTGPGTKLNKRLNADGTPKAWSKPINRVDEAAYHHDVCYANNPDTKTRNKVCDSTMLKALKDIDNPTLREKIDRSIVSPIIGTKVRFGLGKKIC